MAANFEHCFSKFLTQKPPIPDEICWPRLSIHYKRRANDTPVEKLSASGVRWPTRGLKVARPSLHADWKSMMTNFFREEKFIQDNLEWGHVQHRERMERAASTKDVADSILAWKWHVMLTRRVARKMRICDQFAAHGWQFTQFPLIQAGMIVVMKKTKFEYMRSLRDFGRPETQGNFFIGRYGTAIPLITYERVDTMTDAGREAYRKKFLRECKPLTAEEKLPSPLSVRNYIWIGFRGWKMEAGIRDHESEFEDKWLKRRSV